jgi:adenosylcobinamide-GDP ribazoletransferase
MSSAEWIDRLLIDLRIGVAFLTRLPLPLERPLARGELARALWTAPLVGAGVGAIGAAVYFAALSLHLPVAPAAVLAIAATAAVTGCLHEDGLADVADGFGGGATRERKLEIMRDSRIGSYGVCALVVSFLLRTTALASLADPALAAAALVCAHAAGRASLPAFMRLVPPARSDGMSANAGAPQPAAALAAGAIGVVALLIGLGPAAGVVAIVLLALAFWSMAWLCRRHIQGQTGDVLGALEQGGEIAVLLVAAAAMS